jgi:hypothetical protein
LDALCYDDLDEFGRDIDDPIAELEQDIVHMVFESYGSNCSAPDRSIGLDDALSGPFDTALKHRIETKLADDPRIDAAKATLTDQTGGVVTIRLDIQADQTEIGITLQFDAAGNVVRTS